MTRRDLAVVGIWAAAVFGVSLSVLTVSHVRAVEEEEAKSVKTPTLQVNGLDLSLRCLNSKRAVVTEDGISVLPGGMVPIEFVARNDGKEQGVAHFEIVATVWSPVASNSRTSREAKTGSWEFSSNVRVSPGNTVVAKLSPKLTVKAGDTVQFTIKGEKSEIAAARFDVVDTLPEVVVAEMQRPARKESLVSELAK